MTRAEQETLVRWDEAQRVAHLCTTYPPMARRSQGRGYLVQVLSATRDGEPRSWAAVVPVACISSRHLAAGRRRTRPPTGVRVSGEIPRPESRSEGGDRRAAALSLPLPVPDPEVAS